MSSEREHDQLVMELRDAYDANLRTAAEVRSARTVDRIGPLWLGRFGDDHLHVTYQHLEDAAERVAELAAYIGADPTIRTAEWKTRSHDHAPGLIEALADAGFVADEPESVMIGEAALLADAPTPVGVRIRRLDELADIRVAMELQDEIFGGPVRIDRMLADYQWRMEHGDRIEFWGAEVDGLLVSVGRIEPVAGTEFAGIWAGVTRPEFRGRGIYRAVTAARARSAIAAGVQYIHSDSTEFSRPILERSGLVKVTETVPWNWQR